MTKVHDNATDLITFARLQSQNTTSGSSYLGSDGLLKFAAEDEPRIEYGSDGSLKGLLIEEQRTNLVTYSEDFKHPSWVKNNGSVSADATAAPSGGLADQYVEDTSNSYHRCATLGSVTSGVTYTLSVYAKYSGRQYLVINANSLFGGHGVFDIQSGNVSNELAGTANIEDVGDGWYRCSVTATAASTATMQVYIGANTTNADSAYTGDGTSGIYLWGAQLEEGSFATSYIPTSGSQSTRSPDIASIPVSAFGYNQTAGTVVVEFGHFNIDTSLAGIVSITSDPPPLSEWTPLIYASTSAIVFSVQDAGVGQVSTQVSGDRRTTGGIVGFAMKENSFAASVGGSTPQTDSSGTMSTNMSVMRIGTFASNPAFLNGHIKSIQYFPRRLTDAQLQELTS